MVIRVGVFRVQTNPIPNHKPPLAVACKTIRGFILADAYVQTMVQLTFLVPIVLS